METGDEVGGVKDGKGGMGGVKLGEGMRDGMGGWSGTTGQAKSGPCVLHTCSSPKGH